MKVKDLEKGMLLEAVKGFSIIAGSWLRVEPSWAIKFKKTSGFALYIGTKKDVGVSAKHWSDKYVLYNNEIFPVDPSSWRYMQPANKHHH